MYFAVKEQVEGGPRVGKVGAPGDGMRRVAIMLETFSYSFCCAPQFFFFLRVSPSAPAMFSCNTDCM